MKASNLLLSLASMLSIPSISLADDEVIPTAYGADRYQTMITKSPFVLATPPPEPEKPIEASPFDNMYLKGVGTDYVIVQRIGDTETLRFWGKEELDGMAVKQILWSDRASATRVLMKKGSYEKELTFNENDLHAPAPAPTQPRGPGAPGGPGGPGARQGYGQRGPTGPGGQTQSSFKPPTPASAIPRPSVQPTMSIPRPTGSSVQPTGAGNFRGNSQPQQGFGRTSSGASGATSSDPSGGRRRIRDVNNR